MADNEFEALQKLNLNWIHMTDDVWRQAPFHAEGLHVLTENMILRGVDEAARSSDVSPIGLVLQGQRGSGKTHMLGWVRERVHARGGYFFLVGLLNAADFWVSVLASMKQGLLRPVESGDSQLHVLLKSLATKVGVPRAIRRAVIGETPMSRQILDTFIAHLIEYDSFVGRECQETARALVLLASADSSMSEIGETFMQAGDDDHGTRPSWGMRRAPRMAELIVQDLSWLLALTGPMVIAVDQIDTLIAQSAKRTQSDDDREDWARDLMLEQIAGGLMTLRERTRRTLTLVSCLPSTWQIIKVRATDSVQDRFREANQLMTIPTIDVGRLIVKRRLEAQFSLLGFTPPYETWPVRESAFRYTPGYTPRKLMSEIDRHVQSCLAGGIVRDLERFGLMDEDEIDPPWLPPGAEESDLVALDARFAEARATFDPDVAWDERTEDAHMPELLTAGLTAWRAERGPAGSSFVLDPPPGAKPALHAKLYRILDEEIEDQVHWGFRAIAAVSPVAALNRLRSAATAAGLVAEVPKRKLFILRNADWSSGAKTQEAVKAFEKAGGVRLDISISDIRILGALRELVAEDPPGLQAWFLSRRPTRHVEVFQQALGGADDDDWAADEPEPGIDPVEPVRPTVSAHSLRIGTAFDEDRDVRVDLEALRKHVAIFAGSGSGKTVLIRRLVEECALQGVSSIVLDPNNDLARLGDAWPEVPEGWGPDDPVKAARYLSDTDVVIWTPRREGGRPLSFQPLPDFRSVLDDTDEFNEAVEAAVASIVPRAKLEGRTGKAHLGQAVLRKAVRHYGRGGGNRLRGLIDLLSDLPEGVSELADAGKIAADLAQTLTAAMDNDSLFGGEGVPIDPGLLLTPAPGKRARISVISFVGLPSDDQRQGFVNQLQMALFAWIKKNPAGDRPLGGLFVMDEAQTLAPSGTMTACTQSTLALASQARKYGLGLIFATQAPKGLHNRIPGNAATQFFGLLNAPVQIAAAQEMAAAKGGLIPDVSRLKSGQFYVAVEGEAFEKVRTPLCLSYHRNPLTTEEVMARARDGKTVRE